MIVPRHYEDLKIVHENTMPYRAYYMPSSHDMGPLVENRYASDRVTELNGTWQFQYFKGIYDLEEKFYELGYDCSKFTKVEVPGVWQNYGYDSHQYTNVRYPIPLDPPYVPQENPCGAYIKKFVYQKPEKAPKAYLNFEGVDSCFYVWVNGTYVGYSQVSHATSEFDVTDALADGENTLAVLVLKWCDGTYLEDQDKFRMSGIFRDVYLLNRPEQVIYDYFTTTELREGQAVLTVKARYQGQAVPAKLTLYDADHKAVVSQALNEEAGTEYTHKAVMLVKRTEAVESGTTILIHPGPGNRRGSDYRPDWHPGNRCKRCSSLCEWNCHKIQRCEPTRFRPGDWLCDWAGTDEKRSADDERE